MTTPASPPPTLSGSLPALVTPLTAQRELAADEVTTLVRRAVDDGASGVLVAGTTGEGALLEPEQRAVLTGHARRALDGLGDDHTGSRSLLVAGACAPTVNGLHADVARLGAAGADLLLVLAPATYPLRSEELVELHLDVAEAAATPTLVYHIPQVTNAALEPAAVHTLAGHERIVGMKDSSPDTERRAAFIAAAAAAEGRFGVVTGHAPSLRSALEAGASGSILAIANVRQRQVVSLHAAVAAADEVGAAELQRRLATISDGLAKVGTSMPAALKAALQLEGVITERWCRPPLGSVPPDRLDLVRTALLA